MQLLIAHKDIAARAALAKAIAGIEDNDFEVIESGEGEETLELLLDDHSPSLAVIDCDLPNLDGPEICRLVRDFSTGGPTYVVLLAGSHHPDIETGLEAGANDCIRTPARASEIREHVHAGLRQATTEITAGPAGAEDQDAHQLRIPTPRFSSHSASAVSATTKPSISA